MVTANYSWKEVNPKQANISPSIASTKALTNTAQTQLATMNKAQTQQPTTFADTYKSFSEQLGQYENPFLKSSTTPKTYDATLGQELGQNWQAGQDALNKQLSAQATGQSTASNIARGSFSKLADEALRKTQETSALGGRVGTGQIAGDTARYFSQTILPQKKDLEAQLQAQEEEQAATQRQQGLSNLLSMEQASQQAKQFASKQDYDVWATKAGLSEEQANRVFQATTQDIQNKFNQSERLSSQEYGLLSDSLKIEADALQQELTRKNQIGMQDKELEAQLKNLQAQQAFSEKMTKLQMAQDYGLTMAQIGLDQQKVDLQKQQINTDLTIALERLGMDKKVMENEDIARQIELAGMLTSMDDSDETAEMAATMIANALDRYGVPQIKSTTSQTTEDGKLTSYKGVDVATWNPNETDIDTAEKLASSSKWADISKEKGIIDLKNAGIDEMALDGDIVDITDQNTVNAILSGLYKSTSSGYKADTTKRMIVNINGVPYMVSPTDENISKILLTGTPKALGTTLKLMSLDGSGTARTLKIRPTDTNISTYLKNKLKDRPDLIQKMGL